MKRISTKAIGLIAGAMLLANGAAAMAETTLKIVPQADLRNIDPVWTTAAITQNHANMVYDTLFSLNAKLDPEPQMVDSWKTSDDGLTWTFTLRDGLLFHDGSPVESKDVIASIKRWSIKRADGQAMMSRVKEITPVDAKTFEISLNKAFGPMVRVMANPSLPLVIMREEEAVTDANTQVEKIIGSGPFFFAADEWVPGDRVVYKKFQEYKPRSEPADGYAGGKVAKVDRVEWIYIPDTNTATQALMAGEVDVYEIPPIDLMPILKSNPDIVTKVLDPLGKMGHIRPNHLYPPFNDVKARMALQLLIDQKSFLAAQVGNPDFETVCYSVFMCNAPYSTEAYAEPWKKTNKERAKELLAEAGYNFKDPIVVMLPTDQQIIYNNALVMVGALEEIGVKVDAQAMDWSTLTSRRALTDDPNASPKSGWHLFPTWWTGYPMSNPITNAPLVTTGDPKTAWFGWPKDDKIEELRAAFMDAASYEEQMKIVDGIQKRFYEFIPYLNTGQFVTPVAWRSNVIGVRDSLQFVTWNVEKTE